MGRFSQLCRDGNCAGIILLSKKNNKKIQIAFDYLRFDVYINRITVNIKNNFYETGVGEYADNQPVSKSRSYPEEDQNQSKSFGSVSAAPWCLPSGHDKNTEKAELCYA